MGGEKNKKNFNKSRSGDVQLMIMKKKEDREDVFIELFLSFPCLPTSLAPTPRCIEKVA